jgi:hypothetical protein
MEEQEDCAALAEDWFPEASEEALELATETLTHIMNNPFMLVDDAQIELLMRLATFADAGEKLAMELIKSRKEAP